MSFDAHLRNASFWSLAYTSPAVSAIVTQASRLMQGQPLDWHPKATDVFCPVETDLTAVDSQSFRWRWGTSGIGSDQWRQVQMVEAYLEGGTGGIPLHLKGHFLFGKNLNQVKLAYTSLCLGLFNAIFSDQRLGQFYSNGIDVGEIAINHRTGDCQDVRSSIINHGIGNRADVARQLFSDPELAEKIFALFDADLSQILPVAAIRGGLKWFSPDDPRLESFSEPFESFLGACMADSFRQYYGIAQEDRVCFSIDFTTQLHQAQESRNSRFFIPPDEFIANGNVMEHAAK